MDYAQVFEISASGMSVQKTRLEVAAHNLANANTVNDVDGKPYQPLRVVSTAARPAANFGAAMDAATLGGATALLAADTSAESRLVHEPGHPKADANGMVRYPGINHLDQMVTITEALRAYEANVAALQAAKTMAARALDIGGNQ